MPHEDPESLDYRTYRNAIFAFAEAIEANKDSRVQHLSPYRSEQIGSYRYELVAQKAVAGLPVGIYLWDHAIQHFLANKCDSEIQSSNHLFDRPEPFLEVSGDDIFGPGDVHHFDAVNGY